MYFRITYYKEKGSKKFNFLQNHSVSFEIKWLAIPLQFYWIN